MLPESLSEKALGRELQETVVGRINPGLAPIKYGRERGLSLMGIVREGGCCVMFTGRGDTAERSWYWR